MIYFGIVNEVLFISASVFSIIKCNKSWARKSLSSTVDWLMNRCTKPLNVEIRHCYHCSFVIVSLREISISDFSGSKKIQDGRAPNESHSYTLMANAYSSSPSREILCPQSKTNEHFCRKENGAQRKILKSWICNRLLFSLNSVDNEIAFLSENSF